MQLYDLRDEETARKRKPDNRVKRDSVQKRKRSTEELRVLPLKEEQRTRRRKVRADIETHLDIIGEREYEEERRKARRKRERREQYGEESDRGASRDFYQEESYERHRGKGNRRYEDDWEEYDDWEAVKKRRRKKRYGGKLLIIILIAAMLFAVVWLAREIWILPRTQEVMEQIGDFFVKSKVVEKPDILADYLEINEYSRPGEAIGKVDNIFVHYTANPGTTAKQNRDYFQGLADSHETSASAHFIIGMDGEILQCIPLVEVGYAVKEHNQNSISIECCYREEDGRFTDATYESLLHLTAWLMGQYHLSEKAVLRHFDASGKLCPKYFVNHEDKWEEFKADLTAYIEKNGTER